MPASQAEALAEDVHGAEEDEEQRPELRKA